MKMHPSFVTLLCCFLFSSGVTHAQQRATASRSQSSKPATNAPSLDITLKFIVDKLGQEGRVTYSAAVTDTAQPDDSWTNSFVVELSNPGFNSANCSVSFHWHTEVNNKVFDDNTYTLSFRDVTSIDVMSQADNQHQVDSRNGHDSYQSQITPALFTLVVKRPKQVQNAFLFSDEDIAHRVAKAMIHATELCGGGSNEPF